ncbi:hypothetical protein LshimejAT787_1802590 [Lyophyllum shimeji]|uniref:Uncharacterized protein n=1 Tax=Lyophyllum shimeji TaxID=47721 RepID=A0A9P3UU87_LYOSH|nr:hypothetical protein LshimejAT787_1802590 [Lyophyllum shimeji]
MAASEAAAATASIIFYEGMEDMDGYRRSRSRTRGSGSSYGDSRAYDDALAFPAIAPRSRHRLDSRSRPQVIQIRGGGGMSPMPGGYAGSSYTGQPSSYGSYSGGGMPINMPAQGTPYPQTAMPMPGAGAYPTTGMPIGVPLTGPHRGRSSSFSYPQIAQTPHGYADERRRRGPPRSNHHRHSTATEAQAPSPSPSPFLRRRARSISPYRDHYPAHYTAIATKQASNDHHLAHHSDIMMLCSVAALRDPKAVAGIRRDLGAGPVPPSTSYSTGLNPSYAFFSTSPQDTITSYHHDRRPDPQVLLLPPDEIRCGHCRPHRPFGRGVIAVVGGLNAHRINGSKVSIGISITVYGLLAFVSLLGLIGAIARKLALIKLYFAFLVVHLMFSLAVGIYAIFRVFKDKHKLCNDGLKVVKGVTVTLFIIFWLIEIWGCVIVNSYAGQLADENAVEGLSRILRHVLEAD